MHNRRMIPIWVALGAALMLLVMGFSAWSRDGSWHWNMMGWGGLWMLVPIAFMAFMMYMMMGMHGGHGEGPRHEDARAILDRRYAAGEIARDEYERMRGDLERRR
jgi:putative membrane protein